MPDVIVVGGGVIGLSIAWRLAEQGLSVNVLDHRREGASSRVAAGMLAPVTEVAFGEQDLLQTNLESARLYPAFITTLEEVTGRKLASTAPGTLFSAVDRDQLEALRRLFEFQSSLGLDVAWLSPEEARALEPALIPGLRGAVLARSDKEVDSRRLRGALHRALVVAGGEVEPAEVLEVRTKGDSPEVVATQGSAPAGAVVIAAGAWSSAIGGLPSEVSGALRPVKGQILRLTADKNVPLLSHLVRTEEVYLVPRVKDLVVGATVEERGFDTNITAGGIYELLRAAIDVYPAVREFTVVESSAGIRPATPDNMPLIGPAGPAGVYIAAGHYRNGILQAPLTASLLTEMVTTGSVPPTATKFDPTRFNL